MFRFVPFIRHASEQLSMQTQRLSKLRSFNSLNVVCKRQAATKVKRGFEVDSNVKQDVLIYSHPTERFYTLFSYFGVVQCLCLSYIGFSAFQLKDESKSAEEERLGIQGESSQLPWWAEKLTNIAEGKYKNGVSFLCFFLGYGFLTISIIYPQRSVRSLWLLRGGKEAHIKTYSWFGKGGELKVPLENINCLQAREGTSSYVPMKVKGKTFFFLLDKEGTFHNTQLFDYTVGLMRNIK